MVDRRGDMDRRPDGHRTTCKRAWFTCSFCSHRVERAAAQTALGGRCEHRSAQLVVDLERLPADAASTSVHTGTCAHMDWLLQFGGPVWCRSEMGTCEPFRVTRVLAPVATPPAPHW